ncbi:hypothetical protein EI427_17545 [Flammeovirga pectinis]|uniref:T9SS type A sorting domain-containing protein n=1 Tax=Flammeovirga pectinis TaxID=2494373 RepID=A0A3Q9FTA1_9BACT|nr:hypothetical protein [Flammeovirga pectinis]AZQ63961.1 hypothetical protein EI427_17545 [Flammeovirga pectinis]
MKINSAISSILFLLIISNLSFADTFRPKYGKTFTDISQWENPNNWVRISRTGIHTFPTDDDIIKFGDNKNKKSRKLSIDFDLASHYKNLIFENATTTDTDADGFIIKPNGIVNAKDININNGKSIISINGELIVENNFYSIGNAGKNVVVNVTGNLFIKNDLTVRQTHLNITKSGIVITDNNFNVPFKYSQQNLNFLTINGEFHINGKMRIHPLGYKAHIWNIVGLKKAKNKSQYKLDYIKKHFHNFDKVIQPSPATSNGGALTGKLFVNPSSFQYIDNSRSPQPIDSIPSTIYELFFGLNTLQKPTSIGKILPVELICFEATAHEEIIELEWTTASEINSDHFDIEISDDNIHWEISETIEAQGNSQEAVEYESEIDSEEIQFVRLVEYDLDGTKEVFKTIEFNKKQDLQLGVTVNQNKFSFRFDHPRNGVHDIDIILYDLQGNIINNNHFNNTVDTKFTINSSLHGMFLLSVLVENKRITKKIYL